MAEPVQALDDAARLRDLPIHVALGANAAARGRVGAAHHQLITTYKMISFKGKRSMAAARVMEQIKSRQWGLLLLDEVHVFPAKNMQELVFDVKAHCKLGLTATLVREDNKIDTLNFSVGPKLYEANWQDLANSGYLARVQCSEVWCPMTPEFYNLYLNEGNWQHRGALCAFNPNKFRAVAHLMRYHEARGEKVLIFSQDIAVLKMFSGLLNRYHIYGALNWPERLEILKKFKHSTTTNTLCLSSVGDDAIDLPDANVIIQVSAHAGSRRQEAQRLGRILRRKSTPAPADGSPNAWFYTLVSQDTQEMYFSTKRQQFLVDQGYSFQVMSDVKDDKGDSVFNTLDLELDKKLMTAALHKDEQDEDEMVAGTGGAKRRVGTMKQMSGADGSVYREIVRPPKAGPVHTHAAFRNRHSKKKRKAVEDPML
mmetsp:Transcript_12743/g.27357  ORF Transcript_12743/g.27357 Transcript_12743/m.27357 type:complete len:426 (-) Transcript_12743:49-1326(-)